MPVEGGSIAEMNPPFTHSEFNLEDVVEVVPNVELQFIPNHVDRSPIHRNISQDNPESKGLSALRNGSEEDLCFSLQLGDRKPKRKRLDSTSSVEEPK